MIPPPLTSQRRIVLLNTQNKINGNTRWAINNILFVWSHTPFLIARKHGLLKKAFDQFPALENYNQYNISNPQSNQNETYGNLVYKWEFNSTVDVILRNANMLGNSSNEIHPWHLHGQDFWVLAHGDVAFNPQRDIKKFNLINPPMRNMVPLFGSYGWIALILRANNLGVWDFHCHVEAHFSTGMVVVFEGGVD